MPAPQKIHDLVAQFQRNRDDYRAAIYNETQARREFIDPFFKALGWDIDNEQGYAEAYKDVVHETAVKVAGKTKAPDYAFRIGGQPKFFVEAKKPSVNIKDDLHPAFQLRSYAWSGKLPLSILTDFEEFAVYDCRPRPVKSDKAGHSRVMYFTFDQYLDKWDEIAAIFSPEAIKLGSFDKYVQSNKLKQGTAEVDDAFLADISSWRELLARNIALRNSLKQRELNFAVQQTIDRIIFLRIAEDRGIEPYGRLRNAAQVTPVYAELCRLFQLADQKYNSGLFHFQTEKGREGEDSWTLGLHIDDKPLQTILKNLYYPDSPFQFDMIPADILGQVYEQFLGKVIRLTSGGQAKIEDKPEVKKAGGVFYTPTYIVQYIVAQTVGKLLDGRTPGPKGDAAKLRILDPACGSGSFLIGAYQYLLDWHLAQYQQEPQTWAKGKDPAIFDNGKGWRLTIGERKRILLNNIYGVDIDSQAVEVTKLSLLLKVLEGETEAIQQQRLLAERVLPDLDSNIKCGNSLIGPDFYHGQMSLGFLDEEEMYRVNVFDWGLAFPRIVPWGGFDAVIGNPPWGADLKEQDLEFLRKTYSRIVDRMVDTYIYFCDKALQLVKSTGSIGFIIPSTILNQTDTKSARLTLLNFGISDLINLGKDIFGTKVLNTSTILVCAARENNLNLAIGDFSLLKLEDRRLHLEQNNFEIVNWDEWKGLVKRDPHFTFFVRSIRAGILLDDLRAKHILLDDVVDGEIQRGVSPDVASAHVISKDELNGINIELEILKPSISGKQIKRYKDWNSDQFIIYTSRSTNILNFPKAKQHLEKYKHLNSCKEVIQNKHPWWSLHRPRNQQIFESPKIIGLTTSKTIELIYDPDDSLYVTDAMYVFKLLPDYNPWACMAILQSKLFLFLYRVANQGESRVIPQVKATKLKSLPFPSANPESSNFVTLGQHSQNMHKFHKQLAAARLPQEKTILQRQIAATDHQMDQLVYQLYNLTPAEIAIVEGVSA